MSANSGEDIYNRVIVEGTTASGEGISVERSASQAAGVVGEPITSPAPDNPSFATNTTSWTASGASTITRDTGVFDTAPAAGKWGTGGLDTGDTLTETFTGTFEAGVAYQVTLRLRSVASGQNIDLRFGAATDIGTAGVVLQTAFATYNVVWTPAQNASSATLVLRNRINSGWVYVDSVALSVAQPTLVDRRGFRRTHVLPVKCSLTVELATQIADVWLAAHKTTPFKGTVRLEGDGGCREILTGANVPPEALLDMTGELLRLNDRIDPDTGGQGRDGRIASVDYDCATDTAVVSLDSRRTSHEALLERLAVVIGSGG